ncbi:MAG: hypothetical protein ABIH26_08205 [Candidatus Eisenbacteria bacterium]
MRIFLVLIFARLYLAVPVSCLAGYDQWTVEGGPFGGRVLALHARGSGGEIFAGTEGGGVFRLSDGRWIARNNGLLIFDVVAIASHPLDEDTMFVGTGGGGVYRSVNGGNSWFPVNGGLASLVVRDISFRPGGTRLFAATAGAGIFYTDDAGGSWLPSSTGLSEPSVRALAFAPSFPNICYAGTDGGVFLSLDGGATWTPRSAGLAHPLVADLAVHPSNASLAYAATLGGGVYRTTNGGLSWSARRTGMGEVYAEELLIRPDRPDTIWAATRNGVFETFDAGGGWTARATGLADTNARALLFEEDTLYVGTFWGGVSVAAAPASGWSARNEGLTNRFVWELAVSPHDSGVVWAASYGGLSVTTDTGWTWSDASNGIDRYDMRTVAISPVDPERLYAGAFYGGVFRSGDGGATWVPSNGGLPATATVTAIRCRAGSAGQVLCGTWVGMYRSVNGGLSWSLSTSGLGYKKVWGMAAVETAPPLVYAGTYEQGLFRSRDFGATWDSVPIPELFVRAIAIDPTDTSIVYAGGYYKQGGAGGVYKSTNGGAGWTRKNNGLIDRSVWCLTVDEQDPLHVLAATAGGICETWDGGESWEPVLAGLVPPDARWISLAAGRLLAGSFGGSVPWYEDAIVSVAGGHARPVGSLTIGASPNPFNPSTRLRVEFGGTVSSIDLSVYDIRGRLVRTLHRGSLGARVLVLPWDGTDESRRLLPSGVYFAAASSGEARAVRRVVLVR